MITAAKAGERFVDGPLVEFFRVIYGTRRCCSGNDSGSSATRRSTASCTESSSSATTSSSSASTSGTATTSTRGERRSGRGTSRPSGPTGSKPIVYQHQTGGIFDDEWTPLLAGVLRDLEPEAVIELVKAVLGLREAAWGHLIETGLDPDTYVDGQARDTLVAVGDRMRVYMGIGVDAPRSRSDQAVCTPEIVRRSVLASYRAGAHGVIFGPAYSGMNLTTLDGGAQALQELGLLEAATP